MPPRVRRHSNAAFASPLNDQDGVGLADGVAGVESSDGAAGALRSSV